MPIIIINFYVAYIFSNLNSEAQQNRIIKYNREQGRAKVSIRTRDNRTFMVEMQFGIDVLSFFRKIAIVTDVFKVMGRSFQTQGAATEKARSPKLSFVLGTIHCEIDDLSCVGIFERFNKIAIPNNKFQMASGQGSHWLIESPTIFSPMCSPPLSYICQFYF